MIIMYLHIVKGQKILEEKSSGQKISEINLFLNFQKKKIREIVLFLSFHEFLWPRLFIIFWPFILLF